MAETSCNQLLLIIDSATYMLIKIYSTTEHMHKGGSRATRQGKKALVVLSLHTHISWYEEVAQSLPSTLQSDPSEEEDGQDQEGEGGGDIDSLSRGWGRWRGVGQGGAGG